MKNLIIFLLLLNPFSLLSSLDIIIAYEDKAQPPNYLDDSDIVPADPGVCVEMVKMLEVYIPDIKIHLVRYPWQRCLNELKSGNVDMIFNASYSESRLQYGLYPTKNHKIDSDKRLTKISYAFYKLKSSNVDFDGTKFIHLTKPIGTIIGYSINDDLQKMQINVEPIKNTESNLLKILNGRIDGAALQEVTADSFIKNNPKKFQNIVKDDDIIKTKSYYLMISYQFYKKNPKLSEEIWESIKKIRINHYNEFYEKYKRLGNHK